MKLRSGKLTMSGELADLFESQIGALRLTELSIQRSHAVAAASLPSIHKDPFDRMLIAQALVEGLTIVTADAAIERYAVQTVW